MNTKILVILCAIIVGISFFIMEYDYEVAVVSWEEPPNFELANVSFDVDCVFSDKNGRRAYPWGIEVWSGSPEGVFFEDGSVMLIGFSLDDSIALAIPDYSNKPLVEEGKCYFQSFEIKCENVIGEVRVMHQWFNTSRKILFPFQSDYGEGESGSSNWHKISLTRFAPKGAVRGDIVIELRGIGTVQIRNPCYRGADFYEYVKYRTTLSNTYLACFWIIFFSFTVLGTFVAVLVNTRRERRKEKLGIRSKKDTVILLLIFLVGIFTGTFLILSGISPIPFPFSWGM